MTIGMPGIFISFYLFINDLQHNSNQTSFCNDSEILTMLLENWPWLNISQVDLILATNWNCGVKLETELGWFQRPGRWLQAQGSVLIGQCSCFLDSDWLWIRSSHWIIQTEQSPDLNPTKFWCRLNFINQHKIGKNKIWIKV